MSKRQENFIEAGIEYRFKQGKPMAIGGGNFAEMAREANRNMVYEDGCEHGYQYAKKKIEDYLLCVELSNFFPTLNDEEADKGKEALTKSIKEFLEEM